MSGPPRAPSTPPHTAEKHQPRGAMRDSAITQHDLSLSLSPSLAQKHDENDALLRKIDKLRKALSMLLLPTEVHQVLYRVVRAWRDLVHLRSVLEHSVVTWQMRSCRIYVKRSLAEWSRLFFERGDQNDCHVCIYMYVCM